jgi:hypothetical protein
LCFSVRDVTIEVAVLGDNSDISGGCNRATRADRILRVSATIDVECERRISEKSVPPARDRAGAIAADSSAHGDNRAAKAVSEAQICAVVTKLRILDR